MMTQQQTPLVHLTWSALAWRLLFTLILLLILAGPGFVAFDAVTTSPTAQTLPVVAVR